MTDLLLYVLLPYSALLLAVVTIVLRFRRRAFSVTSLSSQFLEGEELFHGSVPWHFGILGVFFGHLIGLLVPRSVLWFNSVPARLYILEATGLIFGLLALVGILSLLVRRASSPRIRAVTTSMDVVLLVLLAAQVALGVYVAIFNRWGSSWYASSAVPYLRSMLILQPDVTLIAPLPATVKAHFLGAYMIVAILPFSRLIHMLVVPLHYLWRPYQIVIWNRNRRRPRVATAAVVRPSRAIRPGSVPTVVTDPATTANAAERDRVEGEHSAIR